MVHVIAFTGMPGSGKTEAVAEAQAQSIPVLRMGDFVRDETKRRGLPLEDAHLGRVAMDLRKTMGKDYWARLTCDAIQARHGGDRLVVVDGVRNYEEVEAFRKRLPGRFNLVAVVADETRRRARLLQRGRSDDPMRVHEVEERDRREIDYGIGNAIERADVTIRNDGDLGQLRRRVREALARLTASKP